METRKLEKINVFVDILEKISTLSTSSKLKVAAIAFKRDFKNIAAFGYNGSYKNANVNSITGTEEESLLPGQSGFVHAEMNMIAKFREQDPENYIVFLTHSPCSICSKLLINADFQYIFWKEEYRETKHLDKYFNGNVKAYGKIDDLCDNIDLLNTTFGKNNKI
jgi:dCMP deaminase